MDIIGKESLELLLKEYAGTILFVSHDRFFVNKIADSLLIFKKGDVKFFDGTYESYENTKSGDIEEKRIVEKKEKTVNNTYLMQKEKNKIITRIKKIERDITELENKVAELNEELLKEEVYTNYEKLTEVQNKIQNLNEKIENDMNEWEELASKLEE